MKKLLLLLCLLPALTQAQKITINGKEGYRQLTWDDFKGKPDKESSFTATTFWSIGWDIDPSAKTGATTMPGPGVEVQFTGESWVNKKKTTTPELLHHEQIHFDIAVLCAAELHKRFADTLIAIKPYRATIYRMYQETLQKCRNMQNQYDRETNHSKNKEEQEKWNAMIAKELARFEQLSTSVQ